MRQKTKKEKQNYKDERKGDNRSKLKGNEPEEAKGQNDNDKSKEMRKKKKVKCEVEQRVTNKKRG